MAKVTGYEPSHIVVLPVVIYDGPNRKDIEARCIRTEIYEQYGIRLGRLAALVEGIMSHKAPYNWRTIVYDTGGDIVPFSVMPYNLDPEDYDLLQTDHGLARTPKYHGQVVDKVIDLLKKGLF